MTLKALNTTDLIKILMLLVYELMCVLNTELSLEKHALYYSVYLIVFKKGTFLFILYRLSFFKVKNLSKLF